MLRIALDGEMTDDQVSVRTLGSHNESSVASYGRSDD
jgi:hypothetical protein